MKNRVKMKKLYKTSVYAGEVRFFYREIHPICEKGSGRNGHEVKHGNNGNNRTDETNEVILRAKSMALGSKGADF